VINLAKKTSLCFVLTISIIDKNLHL